MIKFFRKIRQQLLVENKFAKYLLYAIGEIVLVVIGILIALQINNRSEEDKNRLKAKDYLEGIASEIQIDTATIGNALKQIDMYVARRMWTITSKNYSEIPMDTILFAFGAPDLRDYRITETTFSKITDMDVLDHIENDSLINEIIRYYSIEKDKYNGTIEFDISESEYEGRFLSYENDADFISMFGILLQDNKKPESVIMEQLNNIKDSLKQPIISFLNQPKIRNIQYRYISRNKLIIKNGLLRKRQASTELLQKIEAKLENMK